MTEYGLCIPNWQDKDAYPQSYSDIYKGNWRWEFLRRDKSYQLAWERSIDDRDNPGNKDRLPAPEDNEICNSRFRLQHLVDPWGKDKIQNAGTTVFHTRSGAVTKYPLGEHKPLDGHVAMVGFDLNRPLKEQFDNAYKSMQYQQKARAGDLVTFAKHRDKWPRYLRVIDAIDQGATPTEIYNHFAEESAGDNEDKLDDFYRPKSQPDATAIQWHKQAASVMETAIRLL